MTLYVPRHFAQQDGAAIRRMLDEFGFAVLITSHDGDVLVSHVPVLVEHGADGPRTVIGHVAAANPHSKALAQGRGFLIFQGPQGYVSPNWYTSPAQSVPTWNYVAVHLRGTIERIDSPEGKRGIVDALTARHEARFDQPWTSDKTDPGLLERMLGAIVGFRMAVEHVDAKFKLSQNRSTPDRDGVIAGLEAGRTATDLALADWMRLYARP